MLLGIIGENLMILLLLWTAAITSLVQSNGYESNPCAFNSMCTCSEDQNEANVRAIHSVSCLSVPFYKFPRIACVKQEIPSIKSAILDIRMSDKDTTRVGVYYFNHNGIPEASISQLEVVGSSTSSLEAESLVGSEVQALVLTNNQIQYVSERALSSSLKSLTSLDLSHNQLDGVPFAALRDLRSLQWVNLHGNQISSVVGEWSHMKSTLATLFLGENDISELTMDNPSSNAQTNHVSLRQLKALVWLNLDGNRIHKIHKHSLPSSIQTISIAHNLLENFPLDIISTIPHIQWLYLRGNQIKSIPEHTFSKKLWLEKIDISENLLKTLPKKLFNGSIFIRDLNLASNDFTSLSNDYFEGLDIRRIILSNNLIEKIDIGAFEGISQTLEYLDLDHNKLKNVPEAVVNLKSLKYLYLSSNMLTEISDDTLQNFRHSLKALSLSGNNLDGIPADALQNCTKISYFNIGFNKIYDIEAGIFTDWGSSLKTLILNNNRITNINSKVFVDLRNLVELSLSFNPLRFLFQDAFYGLDKLESLELSFSMDRDDLPYDIFKNLPQLQYLSLDHNNFHEINPASFDYLTKLSYLNLESNRIQIIPKNLFKNTIHTNLKDIRFSNNELTWITSEIFNNLQCLETISLSNNKIDRIETKAFSNLPKLNKLIFSNNLISTINSGAFSDLAILTKLDLQFNALSEISFRSFVNVTSALALNMSHNQISNCDSGNRMLRLEVLDLSYNNLAGIPKCLEYTALLKTLHMDYNLVSSIDFNAFIHLSSLEKLSLQHNSIMSLNKRAFTGLQSLQTLDLSKNLITALHSGQFSDMVKLRILNLSGNSLSYLPKDSFSNTQLELIDLSLNSLSLMPSLSLNDVGLTLRHLSIQSNLIEHIDITTFPNIPFLHYLDLSNNKITIMPDNVFTSLTMLQNLDLSSNPLRANFKELFHYAQSLKYLNLADTGITSAPHFPLPNLVYLNLSHNNIQVISKNAIQELLKLKLLDLSHCNLAYIPSNLWIHLPNLKSLDLSYNPIKEITVDSFHGLKTLQFLNIQHLKRLTKFEGKALSQLRILSSLKIQTWPSVEHFQDELCYILSHLSQIKILKIIIMEHRLDNQLSCLTNRKLARLEITGRNLRIIEPNAFLSLTRNPSLSIKISGTQIPELPNELFSNMDRIPYLTIDLSYNMLSSLNPETFYGNSTTWDNIGTTLISGGLNLAGNRFRCGCHLAWLGHWIRRWTRESLQAHSAPVELASKMYDVAKEARCWDSTAESHVPIVTLPPVDMSCQASALSSSAASCAVVRVLVLLVLGVFRVC